MNTHPSGTDSGNTVEPEIRVSLLGTLSALLRHSKLLTACAVGACAIVVTLTLVARNYVAASTFTPQTPEASTTRFAGLAAQFGLNLGNFGEGESVSFYAELVRSRELLQEVVLTQYSLSDRKGSAISGTLLQLYNIQGRTPQDQLRKAVDDLEKKISVTTDLTAGTVTLGTKAKWPNLATQINRRILDLVNDFNLKKRQSHAAAERQFIEGRLDQARSELTAAESDLRKFLEQNRRYQDSPQLAFEAARLQRTVDLRQQVYTSLAQSYEQARIAEVRNTPVITVVDRPEGSVRPAHTVVGAGVLGLLLGGFLGVGVTFLKNQAARERTSHPAQYAEFQDLMRSLTPHFVLGHLVRKAPGAARDERRV